MTNESPSPLAGFGSEWPTTKKREAFDWLKAFATAPGAPEHAGVVLDELHALTRVQYPQPMDTAPRDGTLVRLLVEFEEHQTVDDSTGTAWTIGANTNDLHPDQPAAWQFAGWCWSHDHFTEGKGTPIAWLPMITGEATLREQRQSAWRAPDELPSIDPGTYGHYWVAIRRADRVTSYPAAYLNAMPLNRDDIDPIEHVESGNRWRNDPPGDDDECSMLATGWHDSREHSEYDGYYSPLLEKDAELLGWLEVEPLPFTVPRQPVALAVDAGNANA